MGDVDTQFVEGGLGERQTVDLAHAVPAFGADAGLEDDPADPVGANDFHQAAGGAAVAVEGVGQRGGRIDPVQRVDTGGGLDDGGGLELVDPDGVDAGTDVLGQDVRIAEQQTRPETGLQNEADDVASDVSGGSRDRDGHGPDCRREPRRMCGKRQEAPPFRGRLLFRSVRP
ncbi:hypothetical protein OED52_05020 [Rhodococcus sp. Z13]|uniref:Uncharacterized protein n=1 Tax=Rhodococcus sacchari TaxID=2962047 RepID=A0ACD4DIN2_9NOCA|nr:hypothetical protein [Rhodococcus sp. Z13]UYP19919.1 hypothetical protein OED52_05020 [Rhodococcus sp. Z13]